MLTDNATIAWLNAWLEAKPNRHEPTKTGRMCGDDGDAPAWAVITVASVLIAIMVWGGIAKFSSSKTDQLQQQTDVTVPVSTIP